MNCKFCSAPLQPSTSTCSYCGARNEIDLRGVHRFTIEHPKSSRNCPKCSTEMSTINISIDQEYLIEQCQTCFGLFFDPGELDLLLDNSAVRPFNIDYSFIQSLSEEKKGQESQIRYVPCPICSQLMNRINFGFRSGVVIDTCREHGIWLDSGELRRLMEWVKAGGQLLDKKRKAENLERDERRRIRERAELNTLKAQTREARTPWSSWGQEKTLTRILFRFAKSLL